MIVRLLLLFMFFTTMSFSQKVSIEIDTANIRIGEQFLLKISVNDTANVIFPKKLENLKNLEIVTNQKIDTFANSLIKKYLMTGFDSGAFYIPSQQIFIKNRSYLTDSVLVNVATVAVDTSQQKMFPIKAIQSEPIIFDDFKPYIIWVILVLILIAGLGYYLITRKKIVSPDEEITPIAPPYDEAIEKLHELDNKLLWQNNEVKKYYSELTEIIRIYIEKELKIPALEITTFELVKKLSSSNTSNAVNTPKQTIKKLNALFNEADLVKFAKSKPLSHEIENDRKNAEDVINELKPRPLIEESEDNELE